MFAIKSHTIKPRNFKLAKPAEIGSRLIEIYKQLINPLCYREWSELAAEEQELSPKLPEPRVKLEKTIPVGATQLIISEILEGNGTAALAINDGGPVRIVTTDLTNMMEEFERIFPEAEFAAPSSSQPAHFIAVTLEDVVIAYIHKIDMIPLSEIGKHMTAHVLVICYISLVELKSGISRAYSHFVDARKHAVPLPLDETKYI